ncbi:IS481 family transposase, partial [Guyparkeria sp. 1SP6A2]|nr:IS481 family transposase [Guyparkeria sp. 1SP6A2]
MNVQLHALATTTPKVRRYIQEQPVNRSHESIARELGVDATTVKRWRYRDSVEDGSHTAKRLQTTLNPLQEWLVVELRKTLLLTLDDLLVVTREYINPEVSRSGLDRCLRRHGVNRLRDLLPETEPKPSPKRFKDYEPGYLHIDIKYLPQMPDESRRRYLFVAI